MSVIELFTSLPWFWYVGWFLIGYFFWILAIVIALSRVTFGDVFVGFLSALLGPVALLFVIVSIAEVGSNIIIWKRKNHDSSGD